jgi:hypothetical protein
MVEAMLPLRGGGVGRRPGIRSRARGDAALMPAGVPAAAAQPGWAEIFAGIRIVYHGGRRKRRLIRFSFACPAYEFGGMTR